MPLDPAQILENGEYTRDYDGHIADGSAGVDIDARGLPEGSGADVTSPVRGTVTAVSDRWGMVRITDARGNHHDFIHLDFDTPHLGVGDSVSEGTRIGAMGSTVPAGNSAVLDHVHYQIKDPQNNHINPMTYDYSFPT